MEMTNDDDDDEVASHLSLSLSLPPSSCVLAVFGTHVVLCRVDTGTRWPYSKMASLLSCFWFCFIAVGTSGQHLGSLLLSFFFRLLLKLVLGMKLLPTGRKNVFYLTLYGSLLGAGSFLLHHFSMLVNSILVSFGLSGEMHNPVSIFVLLGIVVAGAALGYWMVQKFVISDDGSVDVGVAQFVKWAMRIIAATFIFRVAILFMLINSVIMLYLRISGPNGNQCAICFAFLNFLFLFCQSTLDTPLAMGAFASCLSICFLVTSFKWNGPDSTITFGDSIYSANGNPWRSRGQANVRHNHAEFLSRSGMVASRGTLWNSPRRSSGWSDSPVKGVISPTTGRG